HATEDELQQLRHNGFAAWLLSYVMLSAAAETTTVTLEWAMANLLNHPDVLAKVKTELNNVVSKEGRLMEESDRHALHCC
ncbi:hypothetical protein F2Q69_00054945, partial [Brassica cretica]